MSLNLQSKKNLTLHLPTFLRNSGRRSARNLAIKPARSDHGMSLLEVLISMAVLVFISFGIYEATMETYKLREILSTEGDFYNGIRLATGILQRDISLLYSSTIAFPEKKGDSQQNSIKGVVPVNPPPPQGDDMNQTSNFWGPAINALGVRPSRLIGSEDKLSFVSLSHVRIYKDSPESEFVKISYALRRETNDPEYLDTSTLTKTESPNAFSIDDGKDPMSHTYEILHGIKKLNYTYYQRDGNTWKKSRSWDSDKEETKNIYPDYIEVKIEVMGPKKQFFEGTFKFRPEIPLNGLSTTY